MPRINRSLSDPHGGFIGKPHTRDRMKRQSEHPWYVLNDLRELPARPTIDDLLKQNAEEDAKAWDNNPMGDWPDV